MAMDQFKVTQNNIRQYADLKDGYASGRFDYQGGGQQSLVPFDGELDPTPSTSTVGLVPFDGDLDSPADTKKFKSGEAFKDTKDLVPDLKGLWEQFKKEWANRSNTPMTPEIASRMMQDEHAAGSAVLDMNPLTLAPGMAIGALAGVGSGLINMDASKGLETSGKVMNALLPSTLMGNEDEHNKEGYKAGMAPFTGVMDTLNAVPQGYGEILNAMGAPNAAAQVTDAGKLGIMAVLGTKGAIHMYKSLTGKTAANVADASAGLESMLRERESTKGNDPAGPEHSATAAHADDFAAINPYDVGGHVSDAVAGHPSTIDNVQGELFGDRSLQDPQQGAKSPVDSLLNTPDNAIPYELSLADKQQPTRQVLDQHYSDLNERLFKLSDEARTASPERHAEINQESKVLLEEQQRIVEQVTKGQFAPRNEPTGLQMPMVPDRLSLVPKEEAAPSVPETPAPVIEGNKGPEQAAYEKFLDEQHSKKVAEIDAAHVEIARQKRMDLGRIEGEAELQFNKSIENGMPHPEAVKEAQALKAQLKAEAEAKAKAADDALMQKYTEAVTSTNTMREALEGAQRTAETKRQEAAQRQAERDKANPAYDELARQKEADYAKMEAQRELDFNEQTRNIEERTVARRAFLDKSNLDFQEATRMGDKSLMGQNHTIEMRGWLRRGDINSALKVLADSHPIKAYRDLANYLMDKLDGLKVVMHDEGVLRHGDRDVTGYYDPSTHTVGLSGLGATSPHTVLHELTHAVTSHFINTRPGDVRVMGLKNLYNQMVSRGNINKFPGIVNVKEFVAEAFSNPTFQEHLKGINMNNKSVWQRFVDGVKSIFGLRTGIDTPLTNAFEHAMDLSKQIIEAGSESKGSKTHVLDQFKKAGVPSKLADLMATRPTDTPPPSPEEAVQQVTARMAGLRKIADQFDFTPKPPEEVIQSAKVAKDIPAGTLETIKANLDSGGMFASLRHNNNPIIKATFSYVDQAVKNYEKLVRDNLTNKDNGLKPLLQKLSEDHYTVLHSQLMLDEGQRVRSSAELAEMGWNTDMINTYSRLREIDNKMLEDVNKVRASLNPPLEPISPRMGHLAGRFVGDFSHMVYKLDEHGNREAVMRVTGMTKWGAQKVADFVQKEHPDWVVDKQEYNPIKSSKNADRFNGFRELMNYIGKNDKDVAKALDTLDKYNRQAATNYLNIKRHALDKKVQAGGIIGSEGNKAWLDAKTNAEEGFKAQLSYMDTSYKWLEMQKAMENVSKVTSDPEVIQQQPNAIKWSTAYTDHALHRNQGFMAEFANNLLSEVGRVSGLGHTTMNRAVNYASSFEMRNWMGLGNIPFALKHVLLPFQKMPAMLTYLKTAGNLEGKIIASGVQALESYYKFLRNDTDLTGFQKTAFEYAKVNNVFNVDLADTSGKIQSSKMSRMVGKFADADFSVPEHAIRGTAFFTYAHLLESSGMPVHSALSAAEHLSKFLYTDYAPHEAPRAIAKGGWIGQLAFQVTRYKTNEISELGFFNRERIPMNDADHTAMQKVMSNAPLMVHIGSLLAFTGVTGMLAFNEMDHAYSLWSKYVMGKPDNLTTLLQRSNASDLVKYGLGSKLGIGINPKITEADLLPSPFPTTKAEISQLGMAFNLARYHDGFHAKQLALSMTPSTLRGPLENHMFTQPRNDATGKSLYLNPNTGQGRYQRSDAEVSLRNIGFHSTKETDELNNNYAKTRIIKDNADLADHVMEKAKGLLASGIPPQEVGVRLGKQYASYQQEGQPDFANAISSYMKSRNMDQQTQMKLRAAESDKMGNSLKTIMGK